MSAESIPVDPEGEDSRPDIRQNITALLREHPDWDDAQIATAAVLSAATLAELQELVLPLVEHHTGHARRGMVRTVERKAFGTRKSEDPAGERKRLLDQGFFVPGRGLILWGSATVEDHRARMDYLAGMRRSIDETIDQHRRAIDVIKKAGVKCLYDVAEDFE